MWKNAVSWACLCSLACARPPRSFYPHHLGLFALNFANLPMRASRSNWVRKVIIMKALKCVEITGFVRIHQPRMESNLIGNSIQSCLRNDSGLRGIRDKLYDCITPLKFRLMWIFERCFYAAVFIGDFMIPICRNSKQNNRILTFEWVAQLLISDQKVTNVRTNVNLRVQFSRYVMHRRLTILNLLLCLGRLKAMNSQSLSSTEADLAHIFPTSHKLRTKQPKFDVRHPPWWDYDHSYFQLTTQTRFSTLLCADGL